MKIIHKNLLCAASNLKTVHENVELLKDKFTKFKLQTQGIDIKHKFNNNNDTINDLSSTIANQSQFTTNNSLLLGIGQTSIGPSPF